MAKIYYRRIKAGLMAIDDVPERWREEVEKMLDENLDTVDGKMEYITHEPVVSAPVVEEEPVEES